MVKLDHMYLDPLKFNMLHLKISWKRRVLLEAIIFSFGGVGSMDSLQPLSFKIWSSSCLLPLVNTIEQKRQSNLFCPSSGKDVSQKSRFEPFFLVFLLWSSKLAEWRNLWCLKKSGKRSVFWCRKFFTTKTLEDKNPPFLHRWVGQHYPYERTAISPLWDPTIFGGAIFC